MDKPSTCSADLSILNIKNKIALANTEVISALDMYQWISTLYSIPDFHVCMHFQQKKITHMYSWN